MKYTQKNTFLFFSFLALLVIGLRKEIVAQDPDYEKFALRRHSNRAGLRFAQIHEDHAAVKLFSHHQKINILIEVYDDEVVSGVDLLQSDHIQIGLALPPKAYPENFAYNLHPYYIVADPHLESKNTRLFSAYPEYISDLKLEKFKKKFDYPRNDLVRQDNILVPSPQNLREGRTDYGIVQYALTASGEKIHVLNRENHRLWESSIESNLGDIPSGITYTIDIWEGGYIVNLELLPSALGFVILPQMDEIAIRVDVFDIDNTEDVSNYQWLSTTQKSNREGVHTYDLVKLSHPLYTNHTRISDDIFDAFAFHPVSVFTDQGWVLTQLDSDAIIYSDQLASHYLTEVLFDRLSLEHQRKSIGGNIVQQLVIDHQYVNARPKRQNIFSYSGTLISGTISLTRERLLEESESGLFRYPDGGLGVILVERTSLDPYNWGTCKGCIDEQISIYRLDSDSKKQLFQIYQISGKEVFCQIDTLKFTDFYVSHLDWIEKGRVLVLRLNHAHSDAKRRIKVSWDYEGKNIKIEEVI